MATFSIDFSESENVNLTVTQMAEDLWMVDIGGAQDAAVILLSTNQVYRLGLISEVDEDEIDYVEAAWDYLLSVIEQDEINFSEYYARMNDDFVDLYGPDFNMPVFCNQLDIATEQLKSYLREGGR